MKNPSKFEWTMIVILLAILLAIPADAGAQARRTNSGNRGTPAIAPAIVPGNPINQSTEEPRTSRSGEYRDSVRSCTTGMTRGTCIPRTAEEHAEATANNGAQPGEAGTEGNAGRGSTGTDTSTTTTTGSTTRRQASD